MQPQGQKLELVGKLVVIKEKRAKSVYRSKLFVMKQILTTLKNLKPIVSEVTRYANVSHHEAGKYLKLFEQNQYVEKFTNQNYKHRKSFEYKLTEKGYNLLKILDEFCESLKEFDLEL